MNVGKRERAAVIHLRATGGERAVLGKPQPAMTPAELQEGLLERKSFLTLKKILCLHDKSESHTLKYDIDSTAGALYATIP